MTLSGFNALATLKLGFDIQIVKPYKLCDFKPAYGKIFEDYLTDADFWGSCDVDVILGDLRKFIDEPLLSGIDVYSGIKWYLSGSLFLMRNTEKVNLLYTESPDHKRALQTNTFVGFDECAELWHQLGEGVNIFDLDAKVISISHVLFRQEQLRNVRLCFVESILERVGTNKVFYQNGSIEMGETEFLLLHFIYLKTTYHFIIPQSRFISPNYFIDKYGIHEMSELKIWRYYLAGNFYQIVLNKYRNITRRILDLDFIPSRFRNNKLS